jgi:hypothetical protein
MAASPTHKGETKEFCHAQGVEEETKNEGKAEFYLF